MPKAPSDPSVAPWRARTEEDARLRRKQILRAAETLMARNGFHATSMQTVAREAGVSVGLIYQYFEGKDDLLLAVLTGVLEEFRRDLPSAIARGGGPVERLTAGFRAYCRVINEHRAAAVLAYRETATLDQRGRELVKRLETETTQPLVEVVASGQREGVFVLDCVPGLVAYDLVVLAQAWALKFWYLAPLASFEEYVDRQLALVLRGLLEQGLRDRYRELLHPTRRTPDEART